MLLAHYSRNISFLVFAVLIASSLILLINLSARDCSVEIIERDTVIKQLTDDLSCATKGVLPNGGFCMSESNKMVGYAYGYDSKLCEGLEKIFGYSSVGDMGSSIGLYGGCFLRLNLSVITSKDPAEAKKRQENFLKELELSDLPGKPQVIRSWEGFEAAAGFEVESKGLIHEVDLSKPLDEKYQFDWVLSLEVGEHIPKEGEQAFLDNLVSHACKGVVVSWAILGQRGYHHVNCRPNQYIIEEMKKRGMEHDEKAQKELRDMVYRKNFKNTVMVFRFPQEKC